MKLKIAHKSEHRGNTEQHWGRTFLQMELLAQLDELHFLDDLDSDHIRDEAVRLPFEDLSQHTSFQLD